VFLVPVLLTLLRNSEILSSVLGRSITDENYITFNIDKNSIFRNLRIMKFRKVLADFDTDSENNYQQITNHIETLNKKNNINLIVLNFEKKFSLKNDFENYLLNLNKKVLFITNEPISFNSKFIYREQIVNSKYLTYINNDIQYGSRYILKIIIYIIF